MCAEIGSSSACEGRYLRWWVYSRWCLPPQVQNRKLSERLKERNRKDDQLEKRVLRLEQEHEYHLRLLASLCRHLGLMREHLSILLVPLGKGELLAEWTEGLLASVGKEGGKDDLDTVFRSVLSALQCLGDSGYSQLCESLGKSEEMAEEKVSFLVLVGEE